MQDLLYGVPELAVKLGVDQSTVHRRLARGEIIPSLVVGKRALFTPTDAEAIRRREQQLPAERTAK